MLKATIENTPYTFELTDSMKKSLIKDVKEKIKSAETTLASALDENPFARKVEEAYKDLRNCKQTLHRLEGKTRDDLKNKIF